VKLQIGLDHDKHSLKFRLMMARWRLLILRFAATLVLVALGLSACERGVATDLHQARKTEVNINLLPLGINRSERFKEVRANSLPKAVLDQMGGVADAGEPFNATDLIDDPGVPRKRLIVAAISEHYCAYILAGWNRAHVQHNGFRLIGWECSTLLPLSRAGRFIS
jgi:hypothetical protein